MKLTEIAARILAHLQRFERDSFEDDLDDSGAGGD
jgi:hypothetical protein